MRKSIALVLALLVASCAGLDIPPEGHPDTSGSDWRPLFDATLSDAIDEAGVWAVEDGLLTPSEDEVLWTSDMYDDYILDLEFRFEEGANSGVFIHADIDDYIASSIEIQIADDSAEQWASAPATWHAGAIFGHNPPTHSAIGAPGEWNRMTITTRDHMVWVTLNGDRVNEMDMRQWTSATTNPDGSDIPEWLSRPVADLGRQGHIGLQGKHAGVPIWFRSIRIRTIE